MKHQRYDLSPFSIRTSYGSSILLPVQRRRSPLVRVNPTGRPSPALSDHGRSRPVHPYWPIGQDRLLAERGGHVVFGLDPLCSEVSTHHHRHDDDHDYRDDHVSLSLLGPSYHPAIRERDRPLRQRLGTAPLAAHHVRIVLTPRIVPEVARIPFAPVGCNMYRVSPCRAHHIRSHPGADHPGGYRPEDLWRPLRVNRHKVLPAALQLVVAPPVRRGTADQQKEQKTCLNPCRHPRGDHAPSSPADGATQAVRNGNWLLARWPSTRRIFHGVSPLCRHASAVHAGRSAGQTAQNRQTLPTISAPRR
jgi:hypothetical protein